MTLRYPLALLGLAIPLWIGGCMNYYAIPEPFDKEVNRTVTFTELKRDPEAHKGELVALGGVVLRAKSLKDGTQIEVLQLPLDRYDQPSFPSEASQGRFMVVDPEHHDPAVLKNRRITVVGEVIGKTVDMIDEYEYTYPYLSARFISISQEGSAYYGYPPPYYYPYNYYYWDPYYYGYPYWWYGPPFGVAPPIGVPPPSGLPSPGRQFNSPSGGLSPPPPTPSAPPQTPSAPPKRGFNKKSD
ncbi:MAG TPA: Slp family lipoprotein [Nitrospiria bacterium]|nr:Slp family lipoprotein [Nitrospiria bacterium]